MLFLDNLFLLVLVFNQLLFNGDCLYEIPSVSEGSQCVNNDQSVGICTIATDCAEARRSIKKYHSHNLKRCGFVRNDEIVCCPSSDDSTPTTTVHTELRRNKRKSEIVCNDYAREVPPNLSFHIIDGEDAKEGEFPHMAALGYTKDDELQFNCGGSLISDRFVLTAAHCIFNVQRNPPYLVRLGVVDVSNVNSNHDYNITNITIHPDYTPKTKFHDIALIKLIRKVIFNKDVSPACLYSSNDDPFGLYVTGWGTTDLGTMAGQRSAILQKAQLIAVSLQECNATFFTKLSRILIDNQICAADNTSDSCQGDSGGPLQTQAIRTSGIFSIVGVVSYGSGCGSGNPSVYTRVSSYMDWIESVVWP